MLRNYDVLEMHTVSIKTGASISLIEENLSDNSKVYGISVMYSDQHIIFDCVSKKEALDLFNNLTKNVYDIS